MFKFKNHAKTTKSNYILKKLDFFISEARLVFIILSKAFIKVLILIYFKFNCYIWLKTNNSGYAIRDILSQLILKINNWYLIIHFLKKVISAKTYYKKYN